MRILFLTHAFNSLAQRLWVELAADGHDLSVELDVNDAVTEEAVALWRPDVVVAPFLKRRIPASVWRSVRCLVVHPGIEGDRGPSALDWAIREGEKAWGVTVLEAIGEMDAGPVHASVAFALRDATKGSVYRREVADAAVVAVRQALANLAAGIAPRPLDPAKLGVRGRLRPAMKQADRAIDWRGDDTATVLAKLRAADGAPGVRDEVLGADVYLYGPHAEGALSGAPGAVIATRDGAICRATADGAVWITHMRNAREDGAVKLPAVRVLGDRLAGVVEVPLAPEAVVAHETWREIRYEEAGAVGWLHFAFPNGAMGTAQCERLRDAYVRATARPTRVIVLAGGPDFWSNGIHLNLIEADDHPADASLANIEAIDDVVRAIVCTRRQLTIAGLAGNAGAGGVFLALAADRVFARDGVVLNPHYKGMGNLYGSEYWTYLLPRRVSAAQAAAITGARLPVGVDGAAAMGLVDDHFGATPETFMAEVAVRAQALAADPAFRAMLAAKNARRDADEAEKPLAAYRAEELARMNLNFYGFDSSYHVARHHFVCKVPPSRTPSYVARHRHPALARRARRETAPNDESLRQTAAASDVRTRTT